MRKHLMSAGAAATALLLCAPASAAQFLFDGGIPPVDFTISGTFTTADTANADGGFDILSTSGIFDSEGVTGTLTGPISYWGADNVLYPFGGAPFFSAQGTGLLTSLDGMLNLRYTGSAYQVIDAQGVPFDFTYFNLSPVVSSAVPEPHVWALLLLGFGALGSTMRRRRPVRVAYASAA